MWATDNDGGLANLDHVSAIRIHVGNADEPCELRAYEPRYDAHNGFFTVLVRGSRVECEAVMGRIKDFVARTPRTVPGMPE